MTQGPHYKRILGKKFKWLYRLFEMTYNLFSFYLGLVLNAAFRKKLFEDLSVYREGDKNRLKCT